MNWRERREACRERLRPLVDDAKARRSRGTKDPVEDFLWDYYGLRPGKLLHWSPGIEVPLPGADPEEFPGFHPHPGGGCWLPRAAVPASRSTSFLWVRELLIQTRDRPPFFGCLGLHEWAMVYEESDIRHPQLPLRLSHAETRRVVESLPVRCSHFDAFRFFSQSARRFNTLPLSAGGRLEQEQPACLHANMDLMKWCLKAVPYVSSELLADTVFLALETRRIDMRASPYDVRVLGEEPIPVETPEGRRAYVLAQQDIAARAAPLRNRLIQAMDHILAN